MNRNIIHTLWIAAALPLLLASCQQEELTDMNGASDATPLSITVTDAGYASADKTVSRATENGYRTEFTEGDACGLYLVRDGRIIYDNVKLTATAGDDGAITWQPEEGVTLAGGLENESYFLYYPYQSDPSHPSDLSDDAAFFSRLIAAWEPAADQSDYADYTASDLMTAKGRIARNGASKTVLSFDMTHRMALAVIELPKTVYKFTNPDISDYTVTTVADFTGSDAKPCRMADGSYRYIVNPRRGAETSITGIYADGSKEFTLPPLGIAARNYKTYRVDGAPVTEKEHTLQAGDYFCKNSDNNWYIIPHEAAPDGNVIGVVFWTPDEPAPNNSYPTKFTDLIMRRDHPDCNHALVISLKNIGSGVWQKEPESLSLHSHDFTVADRDKFQDIANSDNGDVFRKPTEILGYQHTVILQAYNVYCKTNDRSIYICLPVVALNEWSESNPVPKNSTEWYIPSAKELSLLANEDREDIIAAPLNNEKIASVTASLDAVKGDNPYNIAIFSSTEYIRDDWSRDYDKAWILQNARIIISYKSDICHFRPILAF